MNILLQYIHIIKNIFKVIIIEGWSLIDGLL